MCFFLTKQYEPSHYENTHPHSILQAPTTQLANMSIDPQFVGVTADVLEIKKKNTLQRRDRSKRFLAKTHLRKLRDTSIARVMLL